MIEQSSIVRQSEGQVSANMNQQAVLMSIEQGNYYGLDDIATRIWALIEQPSAVTAICATLVAEYEVEPAQCEGDVLHFLNYLDEQGLISAD